MPRPADHEYPSTFQRYVALVPESDVVPILERQVALMRSFAASVPRDRESFAYAPGKWSVRQVVGHLVDVERVFGFRAFWFARNDESPLPGFDENRYVERAPFQTTLLADLVEDFATARASNLRMFRGLGAAQWSSSGVANGQTVSVRALAFMMAGHVRHHGRLFGERYGLSAAF